MKVNTRLAASVLPMLLGGGGLNADLRNGHRFKWLFSRLMKAEYFIHSFSNSLVIWGFHAHLDIQSTNTWTAIPR